MRAFLSDNRGTFAVLSALLMLPLVLVTGAAVDLSRHWTAASQAQALADSASLAMAIARNSTEAEILDVGQSFLESNQSEARLQNARIEDIRISDEEIALSISASIDMTFMSLVGLRTMNVQAAAVAKREVNGSIEVALVLDNTYSMIGPGTSGDKLRALKQAASNLVGTLLEPGVDAVRIGLVPYADYVNVGTQYRSAGWMKIPAETPRTCQKIESEEVCTKREPNYRCTTYRDGIPHEGWCTGECTETTVRRNDPPKEQCTNQKIWHGCVASRPNGRNNLHDLYPLEPYPGVIDDIIKCPTPLLALTDDRSRLLSAIDEMVVERPHYRPLTYIPSGLIWGQNVLSPTQPLAQGTPYDTRNRAPRKILILMTDGANTMMYRDHDGHHGQLRGGEQDESKISSGDLNVRRQEEARTNADTLTICDYIKKNRIELYTVSFMVDSERGRQIMRECASGDAFNFDASDTQSLLEAFEGIADSISRVRLAQ